MIDKRLLGRWKSDKRKSLRELRARGDVTPEFLEFFARVSGKLTIHYRAKTKVVSGMGEPARSRYEVVGSDDDSVVLRSYNDFTQSHELSHIFFDGDDAYWVPIGKYREWFRRIE